MFDPAETIVELKTIDDELMFAKLQQSALQPFVHGKRNDCILLKLHREEVPEVIKQLVSLDVPVLSFHSRHSLENYFLSLTTGPQHVEAIKN